MLLIVLAIASCGGLQGQVSKYLFSQGFNQTSSPWCPIDGNSVKAQIYGYRIWDDGAKWGQMQTSNTTPTYTSSDTHINTRATGNTCPGTPMNVIYTFGDTPSWEGSSLPANNCANPDTAHSCTPPTDLNGDGTGTDSGYVTFAADLLTRYAGKITYYEIWNEADSSNFWCWNDPVCGGGANPATNANVASLKNLIRMGWDLKHVAACLDPAAKILSPSFHVGTALTWFHNYNISTINAPAGVSGVNGVPVGCNWPATNNVTGAMTYDYVNVHARGTQAAFPNAAGNWSPEAIITAYNNTVTEINNDNLPNPTIIFNDEFGYNNTTEAANIDIRASYIARSYILSAFLGFSQSYWYQWDTVTIGASNNIVGTAYDTVAGWLIGAYLQGSCTTQGTIWTCPLVTNNKNAIIIWDTAQNCTSGCTTANQTLGSQYISYTDLTGITNSTSGGNGTVPVGLKPILVIANYTAITNSVIL